MPAGRMLFWGLALATLAVYGAMVAWSLPRIAAEAGGLMPFDLRPMGYSEAEARAFLEALTPEGNLFYRTVQHRLDLAYPIMAGLVMALSSLWLFGTRRPVLAGLLIAVAVLAMGADLSENARVGALLAAPGDATAEMIAAASRATVTKGLANTVCFVALLAGLAALVWRRVRARR